MSNRPSPSSAGSEPAPVTPPVARSSAAGELAFVSLLDIVLTVMIVPVALLLGAPVLGLLVGAAVWILQRGIELGVARIARTKESIRAAVGYNMAAMVGRAWLVGLTILAVGTLGEREDGLAAAVLVFAAFTVYFAASLLARSFERNSTPS